MADETPRMTVKTNWHVFGQFEETIVPKENPFAHEENKQNPQQKGLQSRRLCRKAQCSAKRNTFT